MDKKTKGAWLLSQAKSLDAVSGALRLENIQYAGKAGRLYNLLRRNVQGEMAPTIDSQAVTRICQLNGIDRSAREKGLEVLTREGCVDVSASGAVSVLGATATAVLETTATIFEACNPTNEEQAVVDLSEKVAQRPETRQEITDYLSDTFHLPKAQTSGLLDLCKASAILDESEDRGHVILFNNNTFRDGNYAQKAYRLMQALTAAETASLTEFRELLVVRGALHDSEAQKVLGQALYDRLIGVGLFDRLEVSNSTEAVGYITSPDSFQKYGRPFEDDPIDDAKALLASLTYGMTRSTNARGQITMPRALLKSLISGNEIGGQYGVKAIGEDYRELEKRQVVQVNKQGNRDRYTMKLLKRDVGELALTIVSGQAAAPEALLMDGSAARDFKGPAETRRAVRIKHTLDDRKFMTGALDKLRSGG